VTAPALPNVERAILAILARRPGEEISGRHLRGLLRRLGFHRSAPAFAFTMLRLQDRGLATCREVVRIVDGVEVKDRYYRASEPDASQSSETQGAAP
jgi:hypothetical protein